MIGVDLGGTKIAFAAVDRAGNVIVEHVLATRAAEGADAVIGRIAQGINDVAAKAGRPVRGVGIGSPGAIDVKRGVIINAVNLNWLDVPLADGVKTLINMDVPVLVQNDVNVGAMGEFLFGAAQGIDDFVYLAVGTGLGGGAVSGGRLVSGVFGMAMEVGHVSINPHGRLCGCGTHGCAEMYISGKGLVAGAIEHLPAYPDSPLTNMTITTAAIVQADIDGDPLARRVVDEAGDALGEVMAWSVIMFNPSLLLIGGGMGKVLGERLIERARAAMSVRVYAPLLPFVQIGWSKVESTAVGAAALAWLNASDS